MQAQYFHYQILETKPLSSLEEFKKHRRLKVFYHKGTTCVKCGITGTQLALGAGRNSLHWDVYTDDFYPLTVDHIIPKSLGGSSKLRNLQPMCCLCNWKKGNGKTSAQNREQWTCNIGKNLLTKKMIKDLNFIKGGEHEVGKHAFLQYGTKKQKLQYLGKITGFEINPHTQEISVKTEFKPDSWFRFSQIISISL